MLLSPMKHNICMVFIKLQRHAGLGFIIENPTAAAVEAVTAVELVCSADIVEFVSEDIVEYKTPYNVVEFRKLLYTDNIFVVNFKAIWEFEGISSEVFRTI